MKETSRNDADDEFALIRATRIYAYLTTIAIHSGIVVWYVYARLMCDPTQIMGCFGASLIPRGFALMVGMLAGTTAVVLVVDTVLKRYYTGDSR